MAVMLTQIVRLRDLRNIVFTPLHVYDTISKEWYMHICVTSNKFKELENRQIIAIRDVNDLPSNRTCTSGIVISII